MNEGISAESELTGGLEPYVVQSWMPGLGAFGELDNANVRLGGKWVGDRLNLDNECLGTSKLLMQGCLLMHCYRGCWPALSNSSEVDTCKVT